MFMHHLFAFPAFLKDVYYIPLFHVSNTSIESLIGNFGKICVSIFLYLSGYGFYYVAHKKGTFTLYNSLQQVKKIMINYWIIFLIFIPLGGLFFNLKLEITELVKNFFCISCSYNGTWWFIQLYIELSVLFPLYYKFLEKDWFKTLLIIFILFIVNILFSTNSASRIFPFIIQLKQTSIYSSIYQLLLWQPTFFIGYILAKTNLYNRMYMAISTTKIKTVCTYIILIVSCFFIRVTLDKTRFRMGGYIDWLLVIFFVYASVSLIEMVKLKQVFIYLGKHSMNLWLIHGFFCYIYEPLQQIVYYPRIPIIILIWLILLSLMSSYLVDFIKRIYPISRFAKAKQVS